MGGMYADQFTHFTRFCPPNTETYRPSSRGFNDIFGPRDTHPRHIKRQRLHGVLSQRQRCSFPGPALPRALRGFQELLPRVPAFFVFLGALCQELCEASRRSYQEYQQSANGCCSDHTALCPVAEWALVCSQRGVLGGTVW